MIHKEPGKWNTFSVEKVKYTYKKNQKIGNLRNKRETIKSENSRIKTQNV